MQQYDGLLQQLVQEGMLTVYWMIRDAVLTLRLGQWPSEQILQCVKNPKEMTRGGEICEENIFKDKVLLFLDDMGFILKNIDKGRFKKIPFELAEKYGTLKLKQLCHPHLQPVETYVMKTKSTRGRFTCNLCEKECNSDTKLENHIVLQHLALTCNICGDTLQGFKTLTDHFRDKGHVLTVEGTTQSAHNTRKKN